MKVPFKKKNYIWYKGCSDYDPSLKYSCTHPDPQGDYSCGDCEPGWRRKFSNIEKGILMLPILLIFILYFVKG